MDIPLDNTIPLYIAILDTYNLCSSSIVILVNNPYFAW